MHLFVYYKLVPKDFPELQVEIKQLQANISNRFPDLKCKLLKRPSLDDQGRETWMEQYEFPPEIFDHVMKKINGEIAQIGLSLQRANEVFIDVH